MVPGIGNRAVKAYALANPSGPLNVSRQEGDLVIDVPATAPDAVCSVVALEIQGKPVIYRAPEIHAATNLIYQPVRVTLDSGSPKLTTRYTLDGTEPASESPLYTEPLVFTEPTTLKAKTFANGKPVSSTTVKSFERAVPQPSVNDETAVAGLHFDQFEGSLETVAKLNDLSEKASGTVTQIGLDLWPHRENFGVKLTGYISVPADGVYVFELASDDGSRLEIGGQTVVDNDGLHSMTAKTGELALAKGLHPINVWYFNASGDQGLTLKWALAGQELKSVPASALMQKG